MEPPQGSHTNHCPNTPPRAAAAGALPSSGVQSASIEGVDEVSPVFVPSSPPMAVLDIAQGGMLAAEAQGGANEEVGMLAAPKYSLSMEAAPQVRPLSEMDTLPFELKVSVASLLAYGDLVALRACSAEMQAVADHVLGQQSDKYFCCMACSATIARPAEVFPVERRVGFEIIGAGDASVNGIYEPGVVPHYFGPPAWRKRGTSLFMFRWARTQWCLARLALDEPYDGHITDDWFLSNRVYVAPSGNPPYDEPPCRGWVPVRGVAPAPRCKEAFLPVLHEELPAEEVGTNLSLLSNRHSIAPLCPVANVEFEDSDLTLCVPRNCGRAVVRLADEVTLDQRVFSRHRQLDVPCTFRVRPAHCPGCDLFIGLHVVSFIEPQGHARMPNGRSPHGREVEVGDIDEEWLACRHALQTTYQLSMSSMESNSSAAHCPRVDLDADQDTDTGTDEHQIDQILGGSDEQQDERQYVGDAEGSQGPCIPTGMCEGGGTIVNQLFLGKSYLCLMQEAPDVPSQSRLISCPPVAPTSSDDVSAMGSDTMPSSSTRQLVPVTPSEDLVCRTHGCGNVLCATSQVLSTEHAWSLGPQSDGRSTRRMRGAESACYVNNLRSGSFALVNERVESLAQGPMTVADVSCARCCRIVGWKFVRSGTKVQRSRRRRGAVAGGEDPRSACSDASAASPPPSESSRTGIWALMRRGRRECCDDRDATVDDGDSLLSDEEEEQRHRLQQQVPFPFLSLSGRYGGRAPQGLLGRRNLNQEGRFGLVDSRIRLVSQPDTPESGDEDEDEDGFDFDDRSSDDEVGALQLDGHGQHSDDDDEQQSGDENVAEDPRLPSAGREAPRAAAVNDDEHPGRCRPS